ncbi:GIP, partial [Symbiodinium necroappetens]
NERALPTLKVELACGSCDLHVNSAGTLLSAHPVTPIVSVAALLELGYKINWTKENCQVSHPRRGQLQVDASSGCPEIEFEVALQLISEYEEHVKDKEVHEARVRCLLLDMSSATEEDLMASVWGGGVEAAAAIRMWLTDVGGHSCTWTPPEQCGL